MNLIELLLLVAIVVAGLLLAIYIRLGRIYDFMTMEHRANEPVDGVIQSPRTNVGGRSRRLWFAAVVIVVVAFGGYCYPASPLYSTAVRKCSRSPLLGGHGDERTLAGGDDVLGWHEPNPFVR